MKSRCDTFGHDVGAQIRSPYQPLARFTCLREMREPVAP